MCECIAEVMMNVRSELSPGGQRVLDYMCITPADSSQMSISAGRCGDGLEGNVCEEISERAETDDSSRDGSEPDVSGEDWSDDNTSQITVSWGD